MTQATTPMGLSLEDIRIKGFGPLLIEFISYAEMAGIAHEEMIKELGNATTLLQKTPLEGRRVHGYGALPPSTSHT